MWTAFATIYLTSSLFLTGLAPNLLALSLVKQTAKIDISWTEWFMGMLPVCLLLFIALPLIVYKIYPPEVKSSPDVPVWAGDELRKMGGISAKEIGMALVALLALGLWIFGGELINATTVALLVLCLMVIGRIVEWDDVLANKQAWNVLVCFAAGAAAALGGYSVMTIVIALTVVYFVVHYMFASLTAHTTGLLPVLLTGCHRGAGDAGEAGFAVVLLHSGLDGDYFPLRHRPWTDLLRQRLHQPQRVLDPRPHLRCDLFGGAAFGQSALPSLLF